MAFKKKLDLSTDKVITVGGAQEDGTKNPTSIEGHYLGFKSTQGEYGESRLHIFSTAEGNVGVFGKSKSNQLLTSDLIGQMVRMTFTGMGPKSKGKRPPYLFQVEHDADNTIDVSGLSASATELANDEDEDNSFIGEDAVESDEAEEEIEVAPPARPVAPKAPAPLTDAARKAKLDAIINKSKKSA